MYRANSRLGVPGAGDASRSEAEGNPGAGEVGSKATESHLLPQPAESPSKDAGLASRYSLGRRFGSLWPSAAPASNPTTAAAGAGEEEGSPGGGREGDANEQDDESEGTWEPESEDFSDGASLATDDYSTITRSLQEAGTEPEAPTGDPQSWLRASVSYAMGGWGKAAEPRQHAVPPPDDLDKTAISRGPSRKLRSTSAPTHHQVVRVEDLEGLLVWQDPVWTAKVFAAGLYFLICMRHLVNGVEIIQPSTVLAFSAICCMLYNSLRSLRQQRKQPQQALQGTEEALQLRVERLVTKISGATTPFISAAVSLGARRLSSHSSKGSRFWLGCCMWLVITLGELGWVTQASLAIYLWAALFTAPLVYLTCRTALDALVDECFAFLLSVVQGGSRGALLGSSALGVGVFAVVDARFFTRVTLALASSAAVLFWQAHYAKRRATLAPSGNLQ